MGIELTRKRGLYGAATLLAIAAVVFVARPESVEVETAPAVTGPLEVTIDEDGRTRAVDRYVISSPVPGRLERIELRAGSRVEAGQVVALIRPMPLDEPTRRQFEAHLSAAIARERATRAGLTQAEAAAEQAKRELERRRALAAEGALAAEQVEQHALAARSREDERLAAAETARAAAADVEAARAALLAGRGEAGEASAVPVRAPAGGAVLRVPERSSRIVGAGEPLMEIGEANLLEAVVDVLSADAVRIRPGMLTWLDGWGGPRLSARVREIEPAAFTKLSALGVEEQRVNIIMDIDDCPPELGDGYRVEARIVVWSGEAVLTVPSSAVFRTRDGWAAFVVEAARARLRPIRVADQGQARSRVIEGLNEGEEVVLFPSDQIEDGIRVRAVPAR